MRKRKKKRIKRRKPEQKRKKKFKWEKENGKERIIESNFEENQDRKKRVGSMVTEGKTEERKREEEGNWKKDKKNLEEKDIEL